MKPRLLIIELWGVGDFIIATPFLRAASEKFEVTLVAKPYALDLQPRFWPDVQVLPFVAPWTALTGKYRLWRWPTRCFGGATAGCAAPGQSPTQPASNPHTRS